MPEKSQRSCRGSHRGELLFGPEFSVQKGPGGFAGYRELDGSLWQPNLGESIVFLSSKDVMQVIEATGPARKLVVTESQAFAIMRRLFRAFEATEKRRATVVTIANIHHAQLIRNRLDRLLEALNHPSADQLTEQAFVGGECDSLYRRLVADCEKARTRMVWITFALKRAHKDKIRKIGCQNLEQFVRGPLSDAYWELFRRKPSCNWKAAPESSSRKWEITGPFARFGTEFFSKVGTPVSAATIASALKAKKS
jgi:hypothetical protein